MKSLQKLILPVLIIIVLILVYFVYFAPTAELGSFRDFDPNNNAVKDIKVLLLSEKGINRTPEGGATFFTSDKHNTVIQVNAEKVSGDIESAEILILRGHLSANGTFHAHDVLPY